jgi:hypothetical protein
MTECCKHEQETPYCGYCGALLHKALAMEELLNHCRKHASDASRRATGLGILIRDCTDRDKQDRLEARRSSTQKNADKWEGYVADLTDALPLLIKHRGCVSWAEGKELP